MRRTLKNSSMAITNLIGPVEQMSLADHPVKGIYFAVAGAPQEIPPFVLLSLFSCLIRLLIISLHTHLHIYDLFVAIMTSLSAC